jgi:hypothetical protein
VTENTGTSRKSANESRNVTPASKAMKNNRPIRLSSPQDSSSPDLCFTQPAYQTEQSGTRARNE